MEEFYQDKLQVIFRKPSKVFAILLKYKFFEDQFVRIEIVAC